MANFSLTMNRLGFKIKEYSPEILAVVGGTSVIAGVVLACKATEKVIPVKEEQKKTAEKIKNSEMTYVLPSGEELNDTNKALTVSYIRYGIKVARVYAPAIAFVGAGLACMFASNRILSKRNASLAFAFASITEAFDGYRDRTKAVVGEETERKIHYGIESEEIEVGEGKDKKTVIVEKNPTAEKLKKIDPYSRIFEETTPGWQDDPGRNLDYLFMKRSELQHVLESKGVLRFNEALQSMGYPIVEDGDDIGWVYDDENVGAPGNYVELGFPGEERANAFLEGFETNVLLTFNCYPIKGLKAKYNKIGFGC